PRSSASPREKRKRDRRNSPTRIHEDPFERGRAVRRPKQTSHLRDSTASSTPLNLTPHEREDCINRHRLVVLVLHFHIPRHDALRDLTLSVLLGRLLLHGERRLDRVAGI